MKKLIAFAILTALAAFSCASPTGPDPVVPTPTVVPSPTPTVAPSPTPTVLPSPTTTPSPTPTVVPSPTVLPSPTPTVVPSPTPSPTYTVTYHSNGGTGSVVDSNAYAWGSSITILSGAPLSKSGYTFACWNAAADGSGLNTSTGTVEAIGANMDLYALYVPNYLTFSMGSTILTVTGVTGSPASVVVPLGVNALGTNTFDNKIFTSITIPAGITSMGAYAFRNTQATDIYFLGLTPPPVGTADFATGIYGTIHVPLASVAIYKANGGFSYFTSIITGY